MKERMCPIEHQHDDTCGYGCGHDHESAAENSAQGHSEECGCSHNHSDDEEENTHGHHHQDGDICGCGADHEHHDHHHHDGDECGCGVNHEHHDHHHHDGEVCGCGEDHEHHAQHHRESGHADRDISNALKHVFVLENLDCANCAAKMEAKINQLPGVQDATITFATKQLRLYAADGAAMLPVIQDVCRSIESQVVVKEKESVSVKEGQNRAGQQASAKAGMSEETKSLIEIIIGAVLFAAGEVLEYLGVGVGITLPINILAYLILGGKIVMTAARNLVKGRVFDENFLMSIATLGAFAIKEYPEAVGVMLFFRIGEYFEHRAVEKSRSQIMDAVDMRPETVNLVTGKEIRVIAAEDARVGDVLLVRPGDRIPLDGRILEGVSRIDTSPVTGEPVPVKASVGDEVISGCVNTSGQLNIRVEKPLEESMVTRILDSVENAAASKPKMERFITRFARVYTPIVVLLAAATAIVPSLVTGNWNYWVYTALTFLVMSCPCALVLSVPLAFFSGIGAGSKKGILFKGGVALESMSHVKAVVMDKTGTITEGNFVLQKVVPFGKWKEEELLKICASCEQNSTHPIGNSIVTAAKERGLELESPSSLEETAGYGISAKLLGSQILCGNRKLMDKYGVKMKNIQSDVYGAEVLVAIDGQFAGYLVIADTVKKDAKSAVARLKRQNIVTAMLTGDAQNSAMAVAKETGVDEVHAKLLPQDKLSELTKIRENRGAVMFVGDGINDAPVLAGADVGAAMGSGADAAIEAADVVFMTSSMEAIPQSLAIAKASSRISRQNVIFALAVKIAVMILGICGFASMWMAVFADTGVAMICVLNSIRILYKNK